MKKFTFLITVILFFVFTFNVSAITDNNLKENEIIISETTEYFEDGSSITTTVSQTLNTTQTRATKTISGNKTKTIRNSDGDILYKFKVMGTFSVNEGVSSTCTAVSCSASDFASGWSLYSSTTSKSGNTANATGIFKFKVLGITTITEETSVTLTCNKTVSSHKYKYLFYPPRSQQAGS